MRLCKRSTQGSSDRITINLASMIDVSFLLLFYFMVATILEDRETRLSTMLQTQNPNATGAPSDFQVQNIEVRRVNDKSVYRLGSGTYTDKVQLLAALKGLASTGGAFVRVFDDVDVGFAVAAVQAAHDAGFEQVTYVPAK